MTDFPSPPPRTVRSLDLAVEILLYGLLAFLPAAYGTVDPWSERIALWMGGAIALALAIRTLLVPTRIDRIAAALVALYLALAAAALIPLPRSLVQSISPATVETRSQLLGDLPDTADALSRMPLSFYPLATRHDLRIVLLAVVVLSAVMIVFRDPQRMRRLLTAITLIGLAAAVLALAQDFTGTHRIYWRASLANIPAYSGPFANHNHFSQFMNLSIGAALALLITKIARATRASHPWRHIPYLAVTIILGMLTIALSFSRGGVIAMLGAGSITLLVLLIRQPLRRLAGVMIALALAVLIALLVLGFDRVFEHLLTVDVFSRLQLARDTSEIIRKFPLTGIGLGAFEWVFPAYNHSNIIGTASHVENEYVQSAAEMGVVGLSIVLAFVALVWWRYVSALRAGRIAVIGLGYGLLAVLVHSLSDYGQHLPGVACLSAATCGLILNLGRRAHGDAPAPRQSRAPAIVASLLVVALVAWSIREGERAHRGERLWNQAQALDDRSSEYGQLLDAAVAAQPDDVHLRYWSAVFHWRTSPRSAADAARVIPMLNAARKLCPTYAPLYTVLGQIEYDGLDQPIGVTHLHTAARLDLCDPTISFVAGRADAQRGQWDSAVALLQRAVGLEYTVMDDVNDLALKELHKPELAIRVAGDSFYRMQQLCNAMLRVEEYRPQASAIYDRMVDLLEQEAQRPGAPLSRWAELAESRATQRRWAEAEKHYTRALAGEPSNKYWRIGHADALAGMGRFADAIAEARTLEQLYPDDPEVKKLLERLKRSGP